MEAQWDLLALHADDDVAVALRDLPAGDARVKTGASIETLRLRTAIPLGHKVARTDFAAGAELRKYGSVIGVAVEAIAAGQHVHVHNLRSLRARKEGNT